MSYQSTEIEPAESSLKRQQSKAKNVDGKTLFKERLDEVKQRPRKPEQVMGKGYFY